jgi:serine/threonine-protein kinase
MREPSPGDVLAEKYRLVSLLGRGGMGSVWHADHLVLKTPVAVKLIRREANENPDAGARFLREAQAAASLRSPHVVQILDFGLDQATPFIVMELLHGESLRQRLARTGPIPFEDVVRIVVHVTRALARAHEQGIVHRDLKPDNVFLVPEVGEEIAKVLDFGVAKRTDESGVSPLTNTGTAIGSPHYMSPEQARGTRAVDYRTDLWARARCWAISCFESAPIHCPHLRSTRPFHRDSMPGSRVPSRASRRCASALRWRWRTR